MTTLPKDSIFHKHLINSPAECPQCNLTTFSFSLHRYLSISYSCNFQKSSEWQLQCKLGCYWKRTSPAPSNLTQWETREIAWETRFNSPPGWGACCLGPSHCCRFWNLTQVFEVFLWVYDVRVCPTLAWVSTGSVWPELSHQTWCMNRFIEPGKSDSRPQVWLSLWAWRRWQEFVKRERSKWLLDKADLEAKGLSLWMWQWWQAGGREEQGVERSRG